jgi:hypothetical protein
MNNLCKMLLISIILYIVFLNVFKLLEGKYCKENLIYVTIMFGLTLYIVLKMSNRYNIIEHQANSAKISWMGASRGRFNFPLDPNQRPDPNQRGNYVALTSTSTKLPYNIRTTNQITNINLLGINSVNIIGNSQPVVFYSKPVHLGKYKDLGKISSQIPTLADEICNMFNGKSKGIDPLKYPHYGTTIFVMEVGKGTAAIGGMRAKQSYAKIIMPEPTKSDRTCDVYSPEGKQMLKVLKNPPKHTTIYNSLFKDNNQYKTMMYYLFYSLQFDKVFLNFNQNITKFTIAFTINSLKDLGEPFPLNRIILQDDPNWVLDLPSGILLTSPTIGTEIPFKTINLNEGDFTIKAVVTPGARSSPLVNQPILSCQTALNMARNNNTSQFFFQIGTMGNVQFLIGTGRSTLLLLQSSSGGYNVNPKPITIIVSKTGSKITLKINTGTPVVGKVNKLSPANGQPIIVGKYNNGGRDQTFGGTIHSIQIDVPLKMPHVVCLNPKNTLIKWTDEKLGAIKQISGSQFKQEYTVSGSVYNGRYVKINKQYSTAITLPSQWDIYYGINIFKVLFKYPERWAKHKQNGLPKNFQKNRKEYIDWFQKRGDKHALQLWNALSPHPDVGQGKGDDWSWEGGKWKRSTRNVSEDLKWWQYFNENLKRLGANYIYPTTIKINNRQCRGALWNEKNKNAAAARQAAKKRCNNDSGCYGVQFYSGDPSKNWWQGYNCTATAQAAQAKWSLFPKIPLHVYLYDEDGISINNVTEKDKSLSYTINTFKIYGQGHYNTGSGKMFRSGLGITGVPAARSRRTVTKDSGPYDVWSPLNVAAIDMPYKFPFQVHGCHSIVKLKSLLMNTSRLWTWDTTNSKLYIIDEKLLPAIVKEADAKSSDFKRHMVSSGSSTDDSNMYMQTGFISGITTNTFKNNKKTDVNVLKWWKLSDKFKRPTYF